ncbi:MAG: ASKHA domain-containing protein [Anaerolineales bacterium]
MPEDPNSQKSFLIDLQPVGRRIRIEAGKSLLAAAQAAGVELISICGGIGICDGCRVKVRVGELSPLTLEEEDTFQAHELSQGFRLACQAIPLSDCLVDIPPESLTTSQRLQVESQVAEVPVDPVVTALDVKIVPPTMHDLRSDLTRLKEAVQVQGLAQPRLDLIVLTDLSEKLRQQAWQARLALHGDRVVGILKPPTDDFPGERLYGLAVDVGTTKLAAYLVDLVDGKTAAMSGAMNPQIGYGEDVISRILVANEQPDGRQILQSRLVATLNEMVGALCQEAGISRGQVLEAVLVGNTAMHHLLAGLPVYQLGVAPYVPAVSDAMEFPANEIGLELAPGAQVYLPPNIAGYVGGDHVAMLLASGLGQEDGILMALDIGTNTEISLAIGDRILTCSTASGPAFEGAHIHDGMRAAPGAIERVQMSAGEIRTYTIAGKPPVGICGSGILDAVAGLLAEHLLSSAGNILLEPAVDTGLEQAYPIIYQDRVRAVVLVSAESSGNGREILITRKDVNEIQLSKGAIRTGIEVLAAEAGIKTSSIDRFIVAGAFGTYLDVNSAMRIGMFPNLPLDRFQQIGNAAGAGARQLLVSSMQRQKAIELVARAEYIELTTHPGFRDEFIKAIMF